MQIQYVELMVTAKDRVQICDTVCWFCKKFVTQFCWFCNEDNELLLMYLLQCGLWFCLANIQYICLVDLKTTSLTKKNSRSKKSLPDQSGYICQYISSDRESGRRPSLLAKGHLA